MRAASCTGSTTSGSLAANNLWTESCDCNQPYELLRWRGSLAVQCPFGCKQVLSWSFVSRKS
jgi:hypothetical protein